MDSDGDARQDSVFITVWKQWDLYLGVGTAPEPAQGWLGGRGSRLQRLFKRHGRGNTPVVPSARSTGSTPGLAVPPPHAQGVPAHGPAGVGR